MNYTGKDFGPDFKWGVSTAAYQTEGGWDSDGKGNSIWDVFANTKGKTFQGDNGNVACDFYRRYTNDIILMAMLKIPNFRFSLSWSRIIPLGNGKVNPLGIEFYNRVIDFCFEMGIEPWITLYHWDLPYELEKRGGWTNRDIISWFGDYVELCMRYFGDRVKNWMILNEPMVYTGAGYFLGVHAPGRKGLNSFLAAAHHSAMCQSEGGRIVRSRVKDAHIGTTFSCSFIEPFGKSINDGMAAHRVDALLNRLFVEPLAGLGYPVKGLKLLRQLEPFIKDGDESKLAFDMDFIGIQNYTREMIAHSYFTPMIKAKVVSADKRNVDTTVMNWEVYPESIYKMLVKFSKYKKFKEIIVTENGAAFPDVLVDRKVHDFKRINFLEQHINQVLRAKREGVNVNGYFAWSFTDNFEWAEGFKPRFGLVYIDFKTQDRIIKDSGYWYSKLIQSGI
ncbi:MAG: GH1 family beta-glucosidase [Bacteroidota bacterium]